MTLSIFSLTTDTITVSILLTVLFFSLVLGFLLALIYMFTHRRVGFDRSFCTTIMLFPVIASVIILLVSNNIARAFSLAGVFTLIRFRTTMSDTSDIMYVFSTVAVGLAVGLGYTGYALIMTAFIACVMLILHLAGFDKEKETKAKLKIIVPESLNYPHVFDPIFEKYLETYKLIKVKTSDFGTTFELTYSIYMKKDINQKTFLDQLRTKNGNLNIMMTSEFLTRVTD